MKPLTEEERALISMPPILNSFPLKVGGHHWDKLTAHCGKCEVEFATENFRGSVDQSLSDVARVEAIGICSDCGVASMVSLRLYENRLVMHDDGQWTECEGYAPIWDNIKILVARLFGRG